MALPKIDYWEFREKLARVIPRQTSLRVSEREQHRVKQVKEKGRKSGYKQMNLMDGMMRPQERLLDKEEVHSFLEVSLRASSCPLPFNVDVWDALVCPFNCKYCFANAFRASLYTSFFDNSKSIGFRRMAPDNLKRELDKAFQARGTDPHGHRNDIKKAIAMQIPARLGIRFENFIKPERKEGISQHLLRHMADHGYPIMINTKGDMCAEDGYIEHLARNPAGAAVHISAISSNDELMKKIEPGAPSFQRRVAAMKKLVDAGVRVVARIEPYLPFLTDTKEDVTTYMEEVWKAGVRHITFDSYSYSAQNDGIRQAFRSVGIDFDRFFLTGCDSQVFGSVLLGAFMDVFREYGFSCSTFDLGNVGDNNQTICCEVQDFFDGNYNWGSAVSAARLINTHRGKPVRWKEFEKMVMSQGGFLSEALKDQTKRLWNLEGNHAFNVNWCAGIEPFGHDEDGIVWHKSDYDFREEIISDIMNED